MKNNKLNDALEEKTKERLQNALEWYGVLKRYFSLSEKERVKIPTTSLIRINSDYKDEKAMDHWHVDTITQMDTQKSWLKKTEKILKANLTEREQNFIQAYYVEKIRYIEIAKGIRKTGQKCFKDSDFYRTRQRIYRKLAAAL